MTLEVNGNEISLDNEGFLLYPEEWDMDIAHELASREQIAMSDDH